MVITLLSAVVLILGYGGELPCAKCIRTFKDLSAGEMRTD